MELSAAKLQAITAHDWLHAFEEDAAGDEVYRPAASAVPPARRPRERLSFTADGAARVSVGGADDRSHAHSATWTAKGSEVVVRVSNASASRNTYTVISIEADRLVVRVS